MQIAFAHKDAETLQILVSSPAFVTTQIDAAVLRESGRSKAARSVKEVIAPLLKLKVITRRAAA